MCKQFCQIHCGSPLFCEWSYLSEIPQSTLIAFMQTITTFKFSMFCELGGLLWCRWGRFHGTWLKKTYPNNTRTKVIMYLLSTYSATLHWQLPQALKIITVISKNKLMGDNFSLSVPPLSQGHLPLPMVAAQRGVVHLQKHIPSTQVLSCPVSCTTTSTNQCCFSIGFVLLV